MTHWRRGPEIDRRPDRNKFDPAVEGARYRLAPDVSVAIWGRVWAEATDHAGVADLEQARRRFHEVAMRIAMRGGRLRPDVGKLTNVETELDGRACGPTIDDEFRCSIPGRETLVRAEARRWRQKYGDPATTESDAGRARESAVSGEAHAIAGTPTAPALGLAEPAIAAPAAQPASQSDEPPGASEVARLLAALRITGPDKLPGAARGAQAIPASQASRSDDLPGAHADRATQVREPTRREPRTALQRGELADRHRERSRAELGRRVGPSTPLRLGFDDYRMLGLQGLLTELGPDHRLRRDVIAAATRADRSIAGRATRWREPLPSAVGPGATTPNGAALWQAAERHAVTLYRRAASTAGIKQDDPAVEAALKQRGTGQPLPDGVRLEMERKLGMPLAEVRIHTDAVAATAARALEAEAFTVGEDIFFASGAFSPDTPAGRKLLLHELTHVAQGRRQGPDRAHGLRVSQPDEPHEREAEAAERDDEAGSPSADPASAAAGAPSTEPAIAAAAGSGAADRDRPARLFGPRGGAADSDRRTRLFGPRGGAADSDRLARLFGPRGGASNDKAGGPSRHEADGARHDALARAGGAGPGAVAGADGGAANAEGVTTAAAAASRIAAATPALAVSATPLADAGAAGASGADKTATGADGAAGAKTPAPDAADAAHAVAGAAATAANPAAAGSPVTDAPKAVAAAVPSAVGVVGVAAVAAAATTAGPNSPANVPAAGGAAAATGSGDAHAPTEKPGPAPANASGEPHADAAAPTTAPAVEAGAKPAQSHGEHAAASAQTSWEQHRVSIGDHIEPRSGKLPDDPAEARARIASSWDDVYSRAGDHHGDGSTPPNAAAPHVTQGPALAEGAPALPAANAAAPAPAAHAALAPHAAAPAVAAHDAIMSPAPATAQTAPGVDHPSVAATALDKPHEPVPAAVDAVGATAPASAAGTVDANAPAAAAGAVDATAPAAAAAAVHATAPAAPATTVDATAPAANAVAVAPAQVANAVAAPTAAAPAAPAHADPAVAAAPGAAAALEAPALAPTSVTATAAVPASKPRDNHELLSQLSVQAKLAVSPVDDAHEREADDAADAVLAGPDEDEAEAPVVNVSTGGVPGGRVHRKAASTGADVGDGSDEIADQLAGRVADLRGGGAPLPSRERTFFESRFGRDFSDVRVHADPDAGRLAGELGARAFTVGSHIAFAPGEFSPGSTGGRRLLAHELAHVVQQTGGRARAPAPRSQLAQWRGMAGDAAALARAAVRVAAPVVLSAASTQIQRLPNLNPLAAAKAAAKAVLKTLISDAFAAEGALRAEGAAHQAEIDGQASGKVSELDSDGQQGGAKVQGEGQQRGGEIQGAGQQRGGEIDNQGQTKADAVNVAGHARGSEVDVGGHARGGEVDMAGRERGAEVDAAGHERRAQLDSESNAHGAQLDADASTVHAQVAANATGKEAELRDAAHAKDHEVTQAGAQKGDEVHRDAQSKHDELATEHTSTKLATHLAQQAAETAISLSANQLHADAQGKSAEVASGWNGLHSESTGIMGRLDAEAGALCSKFEGKAKAFVARLDKGVRLVGNNIKEEFDDLQHEGERAWNAFMDRVGPTLKQVEQKWSQFTNWVSNSVWAPLKQKASTLAHQAGDLMAKAKAKAEQAWGALQNKAQAAYSWIKDKVAAAAHWLNGLGAAARAWIHGKAVAAHAWIHGKADAARTWIHGKADAARAWIHGKADAARSWIKGRAAAARGWITDKAAAARSWISGEATGARNWIQDRSAAAKDWISGEATGARSWIQDRSAAAQDWISGKADAATGWLRDTGHGLVNGLSSRAKGLVSAITSRGGPIMRLLGSAVNGLISGVTSAGNGAVNLVTDALGLGLQFVESGAMGAVSLVTGMATNAVTGVEIAATGAVSLVANRATAAVNFVASGATAAVNVVENRANRAVNWVENRATGAVNWVENRATAAVNVVELAATSGVNFVERRATGAVNRVERAANGAVSLLDRAAQGAVSTVEGAVKLTIGGLMLLGNGARALIELEWQQIKGDFTAYLSLLNNASAWCDRKLAELGTWLNNNVIQPSWNWLHQQWGALQAWLKAKYPGLAKCWDVFKEWAGTMGGYVVHLAGELAQWFNGLPPWMQYLVLVAASFGSMGAAGAIESTIMAVKAWNALPPGAREAVHIVVELLGLVPGLGAIPDLVDSALFLAEGDYLNAGLSLVFAIPGLGDVAEGAKMVKDAGKLFKSLGPAALDLLRKLDPSKLRELIKNGPAAIRDWLKRFGGRRPELPNKGGGCFVAGTLVRTPEGLQPIELLSIGARVLAGEPGSTGTSPQAILQTFIHTVPVVLDLRVGSTIITCSTEHPFWVAGRGWVTAGELSVHDALSSASGAQLAVDSIASRTGSFTVYNISVEGLATYYVSPLEIFVHNKAQWIPPEKRRRPGKGNRTHGEPAPTKPVPNSGPNWGIPEGGVPVQERLGKDGITVPQYAKDDPGAYYYDPATGKYPRRIGFPVDEGASHGIPCFPAGTLVATPDGPREIERIVPGHWVLAYQEQTGKAVARRVQKCHVSSADWLYRISSGASAVLATGDHLFWIGPGEYRAARDLAPGVALLSADGERREIASIEAIHTERQPTYNLSVETDFTYYVGPDRLLVHNDGPFGVYIGRVLADKGGGEKASEVAYVGLTAKPLKVRQGEHHGDARREPGKYAGKVDVQLEWARDGEGKLLTNLSEDEAKYWERKIYDREVAAGAKLANRQIPYTDASMQKLIKKYCSK